MSSSNSLSSKSNARSLVVLSGGQDSTTCLYWALGRFGAGNVSAVTFDYGQRHRIELDCAAAVARSASVPQTVLPIDTFRALGGDALTDETIAVEDFDEAETGDLPTTFVPGRNLIFLTFAAALAWQRGIGHIVTGVAQTDYSGYPDCRAETMEALQQCLRLGMETDVELHTPLMDLSKAETVQLAIEVGALDAMALTHTCCGGLRTGRHRRPVAGQHVTYSVREMYFTLQGEGARTGRAAVFLRFAGCNLWSGREQHRASAVCRFCDTAFVGTGGPGGGKFCSAPLLADAVERLWPGASPGGSRYVVCTGGEPLLQLDAPLIDELHARGFEVGVETNGTLEAPAGIDWLCVSPKADAPLVQASGDELKLVYPQEEPAARPERFADLQFEHFFLQPMDSDRLADNTRAAVDYCLEHPQWKLSIQSHKILGID